MTTIAQRAEYYNSAFAAFPASHLWVRQEKGREVLYGIWQLGNDYRNPTRYYGAYPKGYLTRVMALFPDMWGDETLHLFSGSLPPGNYLRCDLTQDCELPGSAYDLPEMLGGCPAFRLILADPPYSEEDAKKYSTPMVNRGKTFRALAEIAYPGAFCVWLDTVWPMHRSAQWVTVGRIPIIRSTNHRVRLCSIFQRV